MCNPPSESGERPETDGGEGEQFWRNDYSDVLDTLLRAMPSNGGVTEYEVGASIRALKRLGDSLAARPSPGARTGETA